MKARFSATIREIPRYASSVARKVRQNKRSKTGTPGDNRLGEFLAKAREASGLTLVEVAEAVGLKSGQSVWDWENGKGSGIPVDTLLKLVKLYKVSSAQAYDLLIDFHQDKVRRKVTAKFENAKAKILGRR